MEGYVYICLNIVEGRQLPRFALPTKYHKFQYLRESLGKKGRLVIDQRAQDVSQIGEFVLLTLELSM